MGLGGVANFTGCDDNFADYQASSELRNYLLPQAIILSVIREVLTRLVYVFITKSPRKQAMLYKKCVNIVVTTKTNNLNTL